MSLPQNTKYSESALPGLFFIALFLGIISFVTFTSTQAPAKSLTGKQTGDAYGVYAYIFPPTNSFESNIRQTIQANAIPVRAGLFHNIVIVRTKDPNFKQNALASGAWLVIDPIFAGGCNPEKLGPRPFTKDI